jgi:hypothetical protein
MGAKPYWAFRIGLFLVIVSWFSFTTYQLAKGILNGIDIPSTDVLATIGLSFRSAAAFIALIAILFYLAKRGLSPPEALASMRWVLLLEAVYWFSLIASGIWGFQIYFQPGTFGRYPGELFLVGTGVPCMTESILLPVVLGMLFLKLNPAKPAKSAIKWGLIAATAYIFVFWLLYTTQWLSDVILSGIEVISLYPVNIFGFALTAGFLFLLAVYTGVYARNSLRTETLTALNLKKAGAILTAFGLYFDVMLLLWLLFGSPSGGTIFHTFFVFHNMDLWLTALPLVGVPLIFYGKQQATPTSN